MFAVGNTLRMEGAHILCQDGGEGKLHICPPPSCGAFLQLCSTSSPYVVMVILASWATQLRMYFAQTQRHCCHYHTFKARLAQPSWKRVPEHNQST